MRKFYKGLFIPIGLCLIFFGLNAAILIQSGEYLDVDQIITKQLRTNGVYGSAFFQRENHYKQRLYEITKPQVVAVGSSRVMPLQAVDFTTPFGNLGSSRSSLSDKMDFSKALLTKQKPALVIFALDFWWFLGDGNATDHPEDPDNVHTTASDIFNFFGWCVSGKINLHDILAIVSGQSPNVGIAGIVDGDGFDRNGSYHYTSIVTGKKPADKAFESDLEHIRDGGTIYAHGDKINSLQLQNFISILDFYKKQRVDVVFFIPPVAPAVMDSMNKSGKYDYVKEFREKTASLAKDYNFQLYDFHDARKLGSSDCEFKDGHHGGEIVYKRILLDMAHKNEKLKPLLNVPELERTVEKYRGHASTLDHEVDFLELGCKK